MERETGTRNETLFWARPHVFLMSTLRPREGWRRGYYNTEPTASTGAAGIAAEETYP